MAYELTDELELRKPVKGSGEPFDSDVYSEDLQKIDDGFAADRARLDALEGGGGIVAADITDSTSVGRALLTAVNAAAARTAIGAGAVGTDLITAATAAAAQDAMGASAVGKALFTAASVTAAREALRLFIQSSPGAPQVGDLRTSNAT